MLMPMMEASNAVVLMEHLAEIASISNDLFVCFVLFCFVANADLYLSNI